MRDFGAYSQKRKAALRRRNIVLALCAAVALGAGWLLMRPAITLSDQPECGMETHTHTEDCYSLETGPAPLVCPLEPHEHGDNCFDAEGNLICQLQEHLHTEDCYGQPETYPLLTCTLPEHTHTEECYPVPEPTPAYTVGPVLDCGMAAHVHGEGCYDGEDLICTIPEHTHTDGCYPQQETEQPTEAAEETVPAWDNLTGEEKRQTLFTALHIETEEDTAAFDALLATYEKTLDDVHTLLLEREAAGEPIETLGALQACLEEAASEEPTESTEPAEAVLTPLDELRQRLGIETEEDAAALDGLLERFGLTPEEILEGLKEMEENPEAEKIDSLEALQAQLEAATAVETLEAVDGALVPKSGGGYTGTVTVDGMTVTVDTDTWTQDLDGCRLSVAATSVKPAKMDHGMVVVDKGVAISILKADGSAYTGNGTVSVTITSETALTTSETPKVYHHVDGELKEYDSWLGVELSEDKKTLTTPPGFKLPMEFLIDHWEPSTETYLDWPGASYSIGYILRKYNVFVEKNYDGTHVVGPVIAGGTITGTGLGGLSSGGNQYGQPHTVPSYIGNTKILSIITAQRDLPVFLGKEMYPTGIGVDDGGGSNSENYWYAEQYVDFAAAKAQILSEMQGISGTEAELGTDDNGKTLAAGGCYEFPEGTFERGKRLNLLNVAAGQDTTIILHGATVDIPTVWLDGKQPASIESGQQSGIVFLCPEATTVNGTAVTGHIVAPNAHVDLKGGYFNGCVIAQSLYAEAEGHMWAYSGQRMPMTTNDLRAIKLLNGKQITDQTLPDTTFTFELYQQNADGSWPETPVQSVNNVLSEVNFKPIIYQSPGDYFYRIQERNESAAHPGVLFDSTVYYAKVTVTAAAGSLLAQVRYYSDEACEHQLTNAYSVTFNNRYGGKLPDTGGPGTSAYILPGAFLAVLALTGLCITRKRRAA